MPKKAEVAQSAGAMVADVVAQNPLLQARAHKIAAQLLDDIEYTIAWGKPEDRISLQKAIVPSMLRALTSVDEAEREQDKAEAYARLREAIGGEA